MNNLTQTQRTAKQAYLERQQAEMLSDMKTQTEAKETPLSGK